MTLMERLLAAGYPRDQMFSHESDLYIFVTPLTMRVVERGARRTAILGLGTVRCSGTKLPGNPCMTVLSSTLTTGKTKKEKR